MIHRVSRFAFVQCPANSSRKRDELRGSQIKSRGHTPSGLYLVPPSEPEPAILSRDSQQPVGRLTHTLTFPRSGMRSFRPQGKVMVQTRKASLNRLITGCHNAHPISTEEPRLVRGSFNLIPPSEPEPVSLSRDSQQPVVGRLTGLDRFSGLNLHLDALLVRTNGLIQGVTTPPRSQQKNHALCVVLLI